MFCKNLPKEKGSLSMVISFNPKSFELPGRFPLLRTTQFLSLNISVVSDFESCPPVTRKIFKKIVILTQNPETHEWPMYPFFVGNITGASVESSSMFEFPNCPYKPFFIEQKRGCLRVYPSSDQNCVSVRISDRA